MKANRKTKLWEWQQKKSGECARCHKDTQLSVEHIIPVYFLEQLGLQDEALNDDENFEYFCFPCNRFKGSRIDIAHPKTKILLTKYVNKL